MPALKSWLDAFEGPLLDAKHWSPHFPKSETSLRVRVRRLCIQDDHSGTKWLRLPMRSRSNPNSTRLLPVHSRTRDVRTCWSFLLNSFSSSQTVCNVETWGSEIPIDSYFRAEILHSSDKYAR